MLTEANEGVSANVGTGRSESYYSKPLSASVFQIAISKIKSAQVSLFIRLGSK